MINTNNMVNKAVVSENYKNTEKLQIRKSIHEKYSTNKIGFQKWMFDQYPFAHKLKVLEIGSGRGEMWNYYFENPTLIEYDMDITVSDFSLGMVEHLKTLFDGKNFSIEKIDIVEIPFQDETFDLVIANSMLYHVKNMDTALSEVKRVLKKDGRFYCSTFGENGIIKFLNSALMDSGISFQNEMNISFTLQNGRNQLEKYFNLVERIDYEDQLKIDKIEDLMDYIYSMSSLMGLSQEHYASLLQYFEPKKEGHYLYIPKEYGMFISSLTVGG